MVFIEYNPAPGGGQLNRGQSMVTTMFSCFTIANDVVISVVTRVLQ